MSGNDFVRVNDLSIHASVLDFYQSAILQPLLVSVSIPSDLSLPGALDDLSHSLDYSSLCACIQRTAAGKESNKKGEKVWNSIEELAEQLLVSLLRTFPRSASGSGICSMTLNVQLIRRIMNCRGAGVEVFRRGLAKTSLTSAFLRDLEVDTIIGVRPRERNLKQKVVLNVSLTPNREYMSWGFDFGGFASHVYNVGCCHPSPSHYLNMLYPYQGRQQLVLPDIRSSRIKCRLYIIAVCRKVTCMDCQWSRLRSGTICEQRNRPNIEAKRPRVCIISRNRGYSESIRFSRRLFQPPIWPRDQRSTCVTHRR